MLLWLFMCFVVHTCSTQQSDNLLRLGQGVIFDSAKGGFRSGATPLTKGQLVFSVPRDAMLNAADVLKTEPIGDSLRPSLLLIDKIIVHCLLWFSILTGGLLRRANITNEYDCLGL